MTKQELMALGLSEEDAEKVLKEHVPYERFKQVNDDRKALEAQLAERDKAIEELNTKVKAGEDAAKSIEQLQGQLKEKDAAVNALRKSTAIELALTKAKAKNTKAALALLNVDKLELQDDGTIKGLDESLEALKKSDGYLFEAEPKAPAVPPTGGFNPPPEGEPSREPMSYLDAVKAAIEQQLKG